MGGAKVDIANDKWDLEIVLQPLKLPQRVLKTTILIPLSVIRPAWFSEDIQSAIVETMMIKSEFWVADKGT